MYLIFILFLLKLVRGNEQATFRIIDEKPEDDFGEMVEFDGGRYIMGSNDPELRSTGEYPMKDVTVKPFVLDMYPVTNNQFREFVVSRKNFRPASLLKGWSYVFYSEIPREANRNGLSMKGAPWWLGVAGASWNRPYGEGSSVKSMGDHPVVHVNLHDAVAYCHFRGKRLPTEYEWEYAARGNFTGFRFPWGDSYKHTRMNFWQGTFPTENKGYDSWFGTSPVDEYMAQNAYGLHDMMGNVWEWTSTQYSSRNSTSDMYVLKGGSYIDSKDGAFNKAITCAARMGQPADVTMGNIGFRCAKTAEEKYDIIYHKDTYLYKRDRFFRRHLEL